MAYKDDIREEYFEWLYNYICMGRAHHPDISYKKMFKVLFDTEFTFSIPNDVNRAKDGEGLRSRFALIKNNNHIINDLAGPCSVLEMMIALAVRCEETIMTDTRYGDRTGQWFWNMMSDLGISFMIDERFDPDFLYKRLGILLNREYEANGRGGLFYIPGCEEDLRKVEIWTQLCWYLNAYSL